jgi:hypothetical protein
MPQSVNVTPRTRGPCRIAATPLRKMLAARADRSRRLPQAVRFAARASLGQPDLAPAWSVSGPGLALFIALYCLVTGVRRRRA